ncbi:MAG: zinc metallopeptidase [Phycisphaeraceae bacterium]|nr:zinc metallopeptidase [Phycisphaeraceae bacterium]
MINSLGIITLDPLYFLLVGPAMLLALWAQFRVKSTYHQTARVPARSGLTGAEAAARLLRANGISNVGIEQTEGVLSDHYDPSHKVLRLSPEVYHGTSLASLGIAAHEAGHAMQDRERYAPLVLRNGIVPFAAVGGNLASILFMIGAVMMASRSAAGQWLMLAAVGMFTLVVLFQLINLPVEFDASRRANVQLVSSGIVAPAEAPQVRRVLSAAAWTYIAATLTAVLTLLYFLIRSQQNSR